MNNLYRKLKRAIRDGIEVEFGGASLSRRDYILFTSSIVEICNEIFPDKGKTILILVKNKLYWHSLQTAITLSGNTWIAVNPNNPRNYIEKLIKRVSPDLLILDNKLDYEAKSLFLDLEAHNIQTCDPTLSLASEVIYKIFTSGTTGEEKLVTVGFDAIDNLHSSISSNYSEWFNYPTVSSAPIWVDASIKQYLNSLNSGRIIYLSEEERTQYESFKKRIQDLNKITIDLTPTQIGLFRMLSENNILDISGHLLIGGEKINRELMGSFSPFVNLYNCYGPTECSADVSFKHITDKITCGKPIQSCQILAVSNLLELDANTEGEIAITGLPVSKSVQTKKIKCLDGSYLDCYLTGDSGYVVEDGDLIVTGRKDQELKVHGHRYDVSLVEEYVKSIPGVSNSRVLLENGLPKLLVIPENEKSYLIDSQEHYYHCHLSSPLLHNSEHESIHLAKEILDDGVYTKYLHADVDGVIIDIGANYGLASILFSSLFPNKEVYSIEPIPKIFDLLKKNGSFYTDKIFAINRAITDSSGQRIKLNYYPDYSILSSTSPLGNHTEAAFELSSRERIEDEYVNSIINSRLNNETIDTRNSRLSEFIEEYNIENIALLKIDVQGGELNVLKSLAPKNWARIGQIVIEVHDVGSNLEDVRNLISLYFSFIKLYQVPSLFGTNRFHIYASNLSGSCISQGFGTHLNLETAFITRKSIRILLNRSLPSYYVPKEIKLVKKFPYDQSTLKSDLIFKDEECNEEAGRNSYLYSLWGKLLGHFDFLEESNFYEVGGDSVLVIHLIYELNLEGIKVTPLEVFQNPVFIDMVSLVISNSERKSVNPNIATEENTGYRVDNVVLEDAQNQLGSQFKATNVYPITKPQLGIIYEGELDGGGSSYAQQLICKISGQLDIGRFLASWSKLYIEHPILRTCFLTMKCGDLASVSVENVSSNYSYYDITEKCEVAQHEDIRDYLKKDRDRSFDLKTPPLSRIALYKTAIDTFTLVWSVHHSIVDGWSSALLLKNLFRIYESKKPIKEDLTYSKYASEMTRIEDSPEARKLWSRRKLNLTNVELLGLNRSKSILKDTVKINNEIFETLIAYSRKTKVSKNTVIISCWLRLLTEITGHKSIPVLLSTSGRPYTENLQKTIGMFVNMIPVWLEESDWQLPVNSILEKLFEFVQESECYPEYHLSEIMNDLKVNRNDFSFTSAIVFEDYPFKDEWLDETELRISDYEFIGETNFPICLVFNGPESSFYIQSKGVFSKNQLEMFSKRFIEILKSIIEEYFPEVTDYAVINPIKNKMEDCTYIDLNSFYEDDHNNFHSIVCGDKNRDFKQLKTDISHLGFTLNSLPKYQIKLKVVIYLERSYEYLLAQISAIVSGLTVVPIYKGDKTQLLRAIQRPDVMCVISDQKADMVKDVIWIDIKCFIDFKMKETKFVPSIVDCDAPTIYLRTSGTTSASKEVGLSLNNIRSSLNIYKHINSDPKSILHASNVAFDAAQFEIFSSILLGLDIYIVNKIELLDFSQLKELTKLKSIDVGFFTTSLFNEIARHEPKIIDSLDTVLFGGEKADKKSLEKLETKSKLVHMYGPTETGVFTTYHTLNGYSFGEYGVPIGIPIEGRECLVYGTSSEIKVPYAIGELYISGSGTAQSLAENCSLKRLSNKLWYATKDLVFFDESGLLYFYGRLDRQIKRFGLRIDLTEIEDLLKAYLDVNAVLVKYDEELKEVSALLFGGKEYSLSDVNSILRTYLPSYYQISHIYVKGEVELNKNGKLSKRN